MHCLFEAHIITHVHVALKQIVSLKKKTYESNLA